jgi:hypothetical protein
MYIVETHVKDRISGGFFLVPFVSHRTKYTSKAKAINQATLLTSKGHDRVVVYHDVKAKPTTIVFEHRKENA